MTAPLGSHNWWREVDTLSQRGGSSGSIILENSLLQELKDHFSKICTDENYTEPMIQRSTQIPCQCYSSLLTTQISFSLFGKIETCLRYSLHSSQSGQEEIICYVTRANVRRLQSLRRATMNCTLLQLGFLVVVMLAFQVSLFRALVSSIHMFNNKLVKANKCLYVGLGLYAKRATSRQKQTFFLIPQYLPISPSPFQSMEHQIPSSLQYSVFQIVAGKGILKKTDIYF